MGYLYVLYIHAALLSLLYSVRMHDQLQQAGSTAPQPAPAAVEPARDRQPSGHHHHHQHHRHAPHRGNHHHHRAANNPASSRRRAGGGGDVAAVNGTGSPALLLAASPTSSTSSLNSDVDRHGAPLHAAAAGLAPPADPLSGTTPLVRYVRPRSLPAEA